jgi:hypothetical protein
MFPELNEVVTTDLGFEQFMVRYDSVTRDPELRKEYDMFMGERMRMSGIMHVQYERGKLDDARRMLKKGYSINEISDITKLPLGTIQTLTHNP